MDDIFQILIFVAFAVLGILPQILKGKNKPESSSSSSEEDLEELYTEWTEEEKNISSVAIKQKSMPKSESIHPFSVSDKKDGIPCDSPAKTSGQPTKKVRLSSRTDARRAFIYSEIFNRKY